MEMNVPDDFIIFMQNMTFDDYGKKYNRIIEYTKEDYIKTFPARKLSGKCTWPREGPLYHDKKIRNMYSLRMSKTNIYIRWLEHQVEDLKDKKRPFFAKG